MSQANKMTVRPAKTQISLGNCQVWSESSPCAQLVAKDPSFLHAESEDSDHTGRMPRLIWFFSWTHMLFCWFCHEAAHMAEQACLSLTWSYHGTSEDRFSQDGIHLSHSTTKPTNWRLRPAKTLAYSDQPGHPPIYIPPMRHNLFPKSVKFLFLFSIYVQHIDHWLASWFWLHFSFLFSHFWNARSVVSISSVPRCLSFHSLKINGR